MLRTAGEATRGGGVFGVTAELIRREIFAQARLVWREPDRRPRGTLLRGRSSFADFTCHRRFDKANAKKKRPGLTKRPGLYAGIDVRPGIQGFRRPERYFSRSNYLTGALAGAGGATGAAAGAGATGAAAAAQVGAGVQQAGASQQVGAGPQHGSAQHLRARRRANRPWRPQQGASQQVGSGAPQQA